jgi:putative oxidoreductase
MNERNVNLGLLVLRIGIGSMFIFHGLPKLQGGPVGWERLGHSMEYIGIGFLPVFWGFMAMVSEVFGGICLIAGIGVRVASALMLFTMLIAAIANLTMGYGLEGIIEIIEVSTALLTLSVAGGGRFTLKEILSRQEPK